MVSSHPPSSPVAATALPGAAGLLLGLAALLILTACAGGRGRTLTLQAVPQPAPATAPPAAATPSVPPAVATAPSPAETARPQDSRLSLDPRWGNPDWVPLNLWAAEQPGLALQRLPGNPGIAFDITGGSNTLRLSSLAPTAVFRGLQVYLGYTPGVSNTTLLVHRLDLARNIQPLLRAPAAALADHPKIMIDPGHGGDNPGARSVADGRLEKDLTLDWALRLAPLLEAQGWQVALTRTNDASISLTDRVAAAEAAGASLFISLHFNSTALRTETRGIETFCLTPCGLPSTITRDYDDDPMRTFPNNAFDDLNLGLAFRLHQTLLQECSAPDRGVRRARFTTVLRGQTRPAALVEGGYLSHPAESRLIATPAYRQQLAAALAAALGPAPTSLAGHTPPQHPTP